MATFVLIPGAGGSGWYFHRLVPILIERGHRAIAVDLPAADPTAGIIEYADTVLTAIGSHRDDSGGDDADLVVLGQSLDGFTAPLVCAKVPATMLVLLNAMVPRPGETAGDWWGNTGSAKARVEKAEQDGRDPEFDPVRDFFHDVPADITEEAMTAGEPAQSDGPFGAPWPLAAWPDVPTRFIQGRDDRLFPLEFQRRVVAERLAGIVETIDELPGGHLLALSRPVELADQLERYLRAN
ncbi:MAG TPA: alpha/beta fold hydrolase [Pseudonocardiaceae bacterium]|jgi:pimeloyl-ACP methyl ester carboxylesterase|nr:alpha/beta fold hydrolase [Pseudonocardiaceae bacterium]